VDGIQYCQTAAIIRYVSKLAKLPKLTEIEELKSDMVIETIIDAVFRSGR